MWRGAPGLHRLERGRVDAVARGHGVDAQPFHQFRRADLALGQREPVEQHARDRVGLRRRQAGDPVRHARGVLRGRGAEHRIDQRAGRGQIGHRHQHVRGRERRILGEPGEQAVVQHFQLACEAVTDVDLDAALVGRRPEFGLGPQFEDRVLDPREPAAVRVRLVARGVGGRGGLGQLVQHVQLRLGLAAPLGQQRMADLLVVELPGRVERFDARGGDDVEPELAARIERVDPHVDPARQLAQQRDVQRRHGRQREHADRAGPGGERVRPGGERRRVAQEAVRGRLAILRELGHQRAPQRRLPLLVVARGLGAARGRALERDDRSPVAPGGQPLGPVGQVMIEHRGDAVREFVAHRRVGRGEVAGQARRGEPRRGTGFRARVEAGVEVRIEAGRAGTARQQPVATPDQPVRRERRARRHAQHLPDLRPQPLREIAERHVRADAVPRGDVELEAPAQRGARHDHLLRGPGAGRARMGGEVVDQRVGERFVAIREKEVEHAAAGVARRERDSRGAGRGRHPRGQRQA